MEQEQTNKLYLIDIRKETKQKTNSIYSTPFDGTKSFLLIHTIIKLLYQYDCRCILVGMAEYHLTVGLEIEFDLVPLLLTGQSNVVRCCLFKGRGYTWRPFL